MAFHHWWIKLNGECLPTISGGELSDSVASNLNINYCCNLFMQGSWHRLSERCMRIRNKQSCVNFNNNPTSFFILQFKFIVEDDIALPVDPKFWDYLLSNAQKDWQLFVYEQDFLLTQFEKTKALHVSKNLFCDYWLEYTLLKDKNTW